MHCGSFVGVVGSSGRQVQPLLPLRSTGIAAPSFAGQPMTVACRATAGGAALSALWIFSAFPAVGAPAAVPLQSETPPTPAATAIAAVAPSILDAFIGSLLRVEGSVVDGHNWLLRWRE